MDRHRRKQLLTTTINTIKERHQTSASSHTACLVGEAHWAQKQLCASLKNWASHTSQVKRSHSRGSSSGSSNAPPPHSSAFSLAAAEKKTALNHLRLAQTIRALRRQPLRVHAAHVVAARRKQAQLQWVFGCWQSTTAAAKEARRKRDQEIEEIATWHWAQRREVRRKL